MTPFGMEEPQIGLPGAHNPLNRIALESGLVHNEAVTLLAGAAITGVFSMLSGAAQRQADREREQREMKRKADAHKHYNKYAEKQDKFNRKVWEYDKKKLQNNYKYLKEEAAIKRRNARANARYADQTNAQKWSYDLMIRNSEQIALNQQYAKSEQLYQDQLDINSSSAHQAAEKEYNRLQEAQTDHVFQSQELELETLLKYETIKAKGQEGRSVLKSAQAIMAAKGRSQAVLIESLTSSALDIGETLEAIANDKNVAAMQAFAQKMLKPGSIPIRPIPVKTPIPIIQDPKKPTKYDFGMKPMDVFKKEDLYKKRDKARKKIYKAWKKGGATMGMYNMMQETKKQEADLF